MKYIGKCNKSVSCIFGSFNIKENEEVPMLIAVKFPQYCNQVNEPEPEKIEEELYEKVQEDSKPIQEIVLGDTNELKTKNEKKKGNQNEL